MNDWLEVHALVDNELGPEERAKVQERLKTCQVTQAEYAAVHQIKLVLATKCVEPNCEEVWQECSKRLAAIEKTRRVESFVGRYAWGLCSVLICFIIGAAVFNRMNGSAINTGDVERVSASLAPLSAPRSQTGDEKRKWLQENLDNSMQVPANTLSVVGGGSGFLSDGRRIARADLQDQQGTLKLYVIQGADHINGLKPVDGDAQYSEVRVNGVNSICWTDHGALYLLSSNRATDQLCQAADSLYTH